jgi:hypothetical protein
LKPVASTLACSATLKLCYGTMVFSVPQVLGSSRALFHSLLLRVSFVVETKKHRVPREGSEDNNRECLLENSSSRLCTVSCLSLRGEGGGVAPWRLPFFLFPFCSFSSSWWTGLTRYTVAALCLRCTRLLLSNSLANTIFSSSLATATETRASRNGAMHNVCMHGCIP